MNDEEHRIQCAISRYLNIKKIFHFAIPNGSLRNVIVARKIKLEGGRRGVSDLEVITPGKNYYVEIKTPKGRQSKEQKEFQRIVESCGFTYLIWRSIDDAISFVSKLKLK